MTDLEKNLSLVTKEIDKARNGKDVKLIAVSKTVSAERMNEMAELGLHDFGENYAQELCEKYEKLNLSEINIYFIGHLQKNKVKYIFDKVKMIQSVDSFELAKEIDRRMASLGRPMEILVQVNIGDEEQKSGVDFAKTESLIQEISALPLIKVKGIMAIPPAGADAEPFFAKMKQLFDLLAFHGYDMQYLSMGMSADYACAIRNGANMVRVGTKLFGVRDYSKRNV